jgi:hypothetical protein
LISECYKEVTPFGHLIQSGNCSLVFSYTYESLFYEARVSFDVGRQIRKGSKGPKRFKNKFREKMRTSKYFATDDSKMENNPFAGFASIDVSDGISWKFRIAKRTFTFTAKALQIGETLEIFEKNRLGAKFREFLGLGKRTNRN